VKSIKLSDTLMVAGLLLAAPAVAQTTPNSTPTAQKQRTDGGGMADNPRATDATAAAWRKQHIDGGGSPDNPRATDATAAAWRKQHIDGGDSPDNTASAQKQSAQSLSHAAPPFVDGPVAKRQ
jgi:hypothetical protein